jgi:hypothetical protein
MRKTNFDTGHTGDEVLINGIYRTFHRHFLPAEFALLRSGRFPPCPECTLPVRFELVSAIPVESSRERFRLLIGETEKEFQPAPSV